MRTSALYLCVWAAILFGGAFGRQAAADPCSSYTFTSIFCDDFDRYCSPPPGGGGACAPGATPDDTAFNNVWPADGACAPVSMPDYLVSGADALGTFGVLCVQHRFGWRGGRVNNVYRHGRDLTPQILAHPGNTTGAQAVNGAGPIDQPISPGGVPPDYVDSMSRTLRPEALKGAFYVHPLDGVNKAGLANMVYYHEIFLDDDHAPVDFAPMLCTGDHFAHDCNCSQLNQDATCSAGACEGIPACTGSCSFYECNGTCSGGPRDGQSCTSDPDCSRCVGGPRDGQRCAFLDDPVCKACESGPRQGESCSISTDCGIGTCATGPRVGQTCTQDRDCGECVGGHRPGATCDDNWDCQWACGPGEQPVCEGGVNSGMACTEDSQCEGTRFPVLKRTDDTMHASFAIGLMSIYDANPCDLDQGYYPSEWRLALYDGKTWQTFKAPKFDIPLTSPPDMMDLYPLYGWNRIDFAIGADHIEVRITNVQSEALYSGVGKCVFRTCKGGANHEDPCTTDADCAPGDPRIPNEYLVARVPRQYKGPFNRYALGPAKGRDVTDPQNPGPEQCMQAFSSSDVVSDEIVLYDGVFASLNGACCAAGTCTEVAQSQCPAQNGLFHGVGVPCDSILCCPLPFADADADGDVDQQDFGQLQVCVTGLGGGVPAGCECWNRDADDDVDQDDFAQFLKCVTGPSIPLDPGNPPAGCLP